MEYSIKTIETYIDNGKHQECDINLPFEIRKGEDGYHYYNKKGKEYKYNLFKNENKIDERWIVHLKKQANESLEKIFEIKVNKDLNKIIEYAINVYRKSLKLEIIRLKRELVKLNKS